MLLVGLAGRRAVDEERWGRATIAADAAEIAAGLAMQRALRPKERERLLRAGGRTSGFWLAMSGAAGVAVGALQESF